MEHVLLQNVNSPQNRIEENSKGIVRFFFGKSAGDHMFLKSFYHFADTDVLPKAMTGA